MAERIQVELVDDIDGSPAHQTVTFALDGVTYEIDLNEQHAHALRSVLERYIERARSPQHAVNRRQEREERRKRQVNQQLTEQIRGAAQRTRERLSQQTTSTVADTSESEPAPEETYVFEAANVRQNNKSDQEKKVPAVVLPQFSSAVD